MNKIAPYIHLLKFHYQIVYLEVIAGVFIVGNPITFSLLGSLVLLFIASHLFLYGGLYTINDIKDIEEDSKNEHKRTRPLPSGKISKNAAIVYAFSLITSGLLIGYLFFPFSIFLLMILLLGLNILYTFVLKHIPFVEFFGNIFTHPPRLMMGIILAGGTISYPFMFSFFWFLFGLTVLRREILKESKGSEHRANMKYYTRKRLMVLEFVAFILMVIPLFIDRSGYLRWYILLVFLYVLSVFGAHVSPFVRGFWKKVYLK